MTTSETVETYARALFELANAADGVDAVDAGFHAIVEGIRGSVELRDALADQSLPGEKKRAIMGELFAGSVAPEAVAIATVVVERGQVALLGPIAYLAAVKPDATLVAEGRQVKQGRRAGFYEIAVSTDDGTPVATVHCVAHRVAS